MNLMFVILSVLIVRENKLKMILKEINMSINYRWNAQTSYSHIIITLSPILENVIIFWFLDQNFYNILKDK